jgi:hypothetical protein
MSERADEAMLSVRIPADLRAAIERAAEREHRTVSGQTRFLLAIAIERQAQQQPATA